LSKRNKHLIVGLVIVAAVGITGWEIFRPGEPPRVRELTGAEITALDPAAGSAEIEFAHPKTGKLMRLHGTVGEECEILLNGEPVTVADLQVGDTVDVRGRIHQSFTDVTVEALWVSARREVASSAPEADSETSPPTP
jgi:hypothetical protein